MYQGKSGYYVKMHGPFFILLKTDVKKKILGAGDKSRAFILRF